MKKKLLITGSSGMLGSNLVLELKDKYDIVGVYRRYPNPALKNQYKIDLTRHKDVRPIINREKPDFVIHCAALTNVDKCETDYSLARRTNATATKNLLTTLDPKTKFIYISTDSVFDGEKGNYSEIDVAHPLNNYAKTKFKGEQYVEQRGDNFIIVRTNICGWNHVKGLSLVEWIFNNVSQKKPINMFTDVIISPITVNTLSLLIDRLLQMNFIGRLNIGSSNSISKYDFGVHFIKMFNLDDSLITPVSIDSFKFKAKRPKNASLNVFKAKNIFGALPTVKNELLNLYKKRTIKQ